MLHFDVDVIDFLDLPIAAVPRIGESLAADPRLRAMTVTELSPDHATSRAGVERFAAGRARALA